MLSSSNIVHLSLMGNVFAEPRAIRYADLGGIEGVLHDIKELVEHPLCHPEVPALSLQQKLGFAQ